MGSTILWLPLPEPWLPRTGTVALVYRKCGSKCSGLFTDSLTQKVTGHKTVAMSDHYTHFSTDDYAAVQKVQEGIFAVEKKVVEKDEVMALKKVGRSSKVEK